MTGPEDKKQLIAARLKQARELAGLSQGQAAKKMNMHRPTVSEIEAGNRNVTAPELSRFAELYDVDLAWLSGAGADKLEPDDERLEEGKADPTSDPDEYAANAFAGFLLMPKIGVRRAFVTRGWAISNPQPEQAFVVACHFGVGYLTLVNHLAYGLRAIRSALAE